MLITPLWEDALNPFVKSAACAMKNMA